MSTFPVASNSLKIVLRMLPSIVELLKGAFPSNHEVLMMQYFTVPLSISFLSASNFFFNQGSPQLYHQSNSSNCIVVFPCSEIIVLPVKISLFIREPCVVPPIAPSGINTSHLFSCACHHEAGKSLVPWRRIYSA